MNPKIKFMMQTDMLCLMIGACFALIMGADFQKEVLFNFKLPKSKSPPSVATEVGVKDSLIRVFKVNDTINIEFDGKTGPEKDSESLLSQLGPEKPVKLLIESGCGMDTDRLVKLMSIINKKGVNNVALVAESDP